MPMMWNIDRLDAVMVAARMKRCQFAPGNEEVIPNP